MPGQETYLLMQLSSYSGKKIKEIKQWTQIFWALQGHIPSVNEHLGKKDGIKDSSVLMWSTQSHDATSLPSSVLLTLRLSHCLSLSKAPHQFWEGNKGENFLTIKLQWLRNWL